MNTTPIMTEHARERCAEMGISTKVAKRIVQHPSLTHSSRFNRTVVRSDEYPDYLVVHDDRTPPRIVTVLFATRERYHRRGETYEVVDP